MMHKIEAILIVGATLSALPHAFALFKLTNARCESFDKSLVVFQQCRLRAVKRDISVLNLNAFLPLSIRSVTLNGQLLRKYNDYKPFIVNFTVDACAFLKRPNNPMAKAVYVLFKDFSNVNHTCPYQGEIIIKDFYPKHALFKLPLPAADYVMVVTIYFNDVKATVIKIYFSFSDEQRSTN